MMLNLPFNRWFGEQQPQKRLRDEFDNPGQRMLADNEKQNSRNERCEVEPPNRQLVNARIGGPERNEHGRCRNPCAPNTTCKIELEDGRADRQAIAFRLVVNDDTCRSRVSANAMHALRTQDVLFKSREELCAMALGWNDNPDAARSAVGNVSALSRVHVVPYRPKKVAPAT